MQEIKFLRIVVADSLGPVVAQKIVQLLKRSRNIRIADPVHHVDVLARVQVMQP